MDTAEYILCRWKWNLWPAKVLSRPETPATKDGRRALPLEVQILSVNQRVQVESTDVMELTEAGIEAIAFCTGVRLRITDPPGDIHWKATTPPGQARSYRKALRLALEILSCRKLAEQKATGESPNTEPKGANLHPAPGRGPCLGRKHQKQKVQYGSKLKNQRYLQSQQRWHSGSEHVLHDKTSKEHTAITASPDGMQGDRSECSNVAPKLPSPIGAIRQNVDEKNLRASAPVSSSPTVVWKGKHAKAEFPGLFIRPAVILTRLKALSHKTKDASQEMAASEPHRFTAFPEGMEKPGESALNAGLERAGVSSASSNSRLPDPLPTPSQKRKRLEPALKRRAKKLESPKHSSETKAMDTRKSTGRRREGRTQRLAPEGLPPPIERGALVWCKAQGHPFWPSVVKSVSQTTNTARVLLIEANMCTEQTGIPVHLCSLKPLDCEEKNELVRRASKAHSLGVTWCFSLIRHYREEVSWGSFMGSFLDYFTTDVSYPVRKALEETDLHVDFPRVNYANLDDSEEETNLDGGRPHCTK
ncbi:PWWP domain-containing DNA repair factor 3B-like [Perognathus longimembris pacificus]|uniref:PWWP domain-containing DNA repair factor 3B-like n=1 Tax=Perognathus longimembris pacificus TaxID=214514 RepID=UPI002019F10D|nr:PWWP domain-containing DNA repair factor 3B-like [Perognathus longimembris pacificus]